MGDEPIVRCGECLTNLAEPLNTPLEQRRPCPECRSLRRNVALTLAATVIADADVTVVAPAAAATTSAITPEAAISKLEELEYRVEWLRLSPGGAWMVRVYDGSGAWIDGSVQDDPADALLAVAERLLPE
jgi:hypothetical protein